MVLTMLAACAGDDGGGGGGNAINLSLDYFGGPNSIAGTVRFPAPVADGARVILALSESTSGEDSLERANGFETRAVRGGASEASWRITGLTDEVIKVFVVVDQNLDRDAPNGGDFGGFYAGTEGAPIGHGGPATPIQVMAGEITGLDFYIGEVTCKAAVGEACSVDADCRGTTCTTTGGVSGHELVGSCQGTCMLIQCPAGETATEGSCLGGNR